MLNSVIAVLNGIVANYVYSLLLRKKFINQTKNLVSPKETSKFQKIPEEQNLNDKVMLKFKNFEWDNTVEITRIVTTDENEFYLLKIGNSNLDK